MEIIAVTGKPIAHSLSPQLFNRAFLRKGIKAVYTRLAADSAEEALEVAGQIGLRGLNVTAPFKQEMAGLVGSLDPEARQIGAVNGVVFSGPRSFGFNTDGRGAVGALRQNGIELSGKDAVVLGAGGAGRAAVHALVEAGAKVRIVNRTYSKAVELGRKFGCRPEPIENLSAVLGKVEVVLSAVSTPESLVKPEWLRPGQVVLDANYRNSGLSEIARGRGCCVVSGICWLLSQAVPAYEIFTGHRVDLEDLRRGLPADTPRNKDAAGISLIGMMGTGKTTIGKNLASLMDLGLIDTDETIEKETGASIHEVFQNRGEEFFRQLESKMVERLSGETRRKVYALGGGAVVRPENRVLIQGRTVVIWLWAGLRKILERTAGTERPLLDTADRSDRLAKLISSRLEGYARSADLIINANRSPEDVVRKIIDEIH